MKLCDLLEVITGDARIRIIEGHYKTRDPEMHEHNNILYAGYNGLYNHVEVLQELKKRNPDVKTFHAVNEIRHREYEERGLFPPFQPEVTREYEFKDLTLLLYYDIYI